MKPAGRQYNIDFSDVIRAYASVSVVVIHVLFSNDWKYEGTALWWATDILHAFVKPAVPSAEQTSVETTQLIPVVLVPS